MNHGRNSQTNPPLDALAIQAWEEISEDLPPPTRALVLLQLVHADLTGEELGGWSIGRRNGALLQARIDAFGPVMTAMSLCPACEGAVEVTVDGNSLLGTAESSPRRCGDTVSGTPESVAVSFGNRRLLLRLPGSEDLIAMSESFRSKEDSFDMLEKRSTDMTVGMQALLERCVISRPVESVEPEATRWPDEALVEAAKALAEADPLAEILFSLSCPHCGHAWDADFDIAEYFRTELHAHGEQLLTDIHLLAERYGWSESEILAVSPARRDAYLDRIRNSSPF